VYEISGLKDGEQVRFDPTGSARVALKQCRALDPGSGRISLDGTEIGLEELQRLAARETE
jgi:hypothetical protein